MQANTRLIYRAPSYVDGSYSPETLVDLLHERAVSYGDKTAFRFIRDADDAVGEISYQGLVERAEAIAAELQTRIAPGERALLVYPPGLDFIEAFFGCLFAGVIAVPAAAPGRRRRESPLDAICNASRPSVLLSNSALCEELDRSAIGRHTLSGPCLATDQIATNRAHAWQAPEIQADSVAFLQYTSGSTSLPKGVVLSHSNLLSNAGLIQKSFGTDADSKGVFWLPLYHDMGLIGGVLQPLYCGGSATLLAAAAFLQRPALWLETISQTQATISGAPDFAYDLCARKLTTEERGRLDLSSWRTAFTGAERVRSGTIDRFLEAFEPCGFRPESFFPCYGLAEATLMVSGGPAGRRPTLLKVQADPLARNEVREASGHEAEARVLVGCGRGMAGQEIRIVDADTRLPCPSTGIGEIWVRGASVARGYFQQPEATAEVFAGFLSDTGEGPYLRTGDLGFLRDGELFVTGRIKDLLIIRGRNYYSEDIETAFAGAHPQLRAGHCAAVAVEEEGAERLVIIHEVEPRQRDNDPEQVFAAMKRTFGTQEDVGIDTIVLTKAGGIPKTSSGKLRRAACRERFLKGELEIVALWQADRSVELEHGGGGSPALVPRIATEAEIQAWLIQQIAGRLHLAPQEIRIATPFLEFGMGSMDAVELASGLEQWLGRRLSPTALYNYPNIAALASWLAKAPTAVDETPPTSQPIALMEQSPADCLAEVQALSDEELAAFIALEMAKAGGETDGGPASDLSLA